MSRIAGPSVILPVYNGAHYIGHSLTVLSNFLERTFSDFQIVVVDDGSTDGSLNLLEKLRTKFSFTFLHYETNRGKGFAIKRAVSSETLKFADVVVIDSDLPADIDLSQLIDAVRGLQSHQVVVMSRYHEKSRVKRLWYRRWVSLCHRRLVRLILPEVSCSDPDVGFKAFKRSFLEECIHYTDLDRWSWDLQALSFAFHNGYKVLELPFRWSEGYQKTTVSLIRDSLEEFTGMLHIRRQISSGALRPDYTTRPNCRGSKRGTLPEKTSTTRG